MNKQPLLNKPSNKWISNLPDKDKKEEFSSRLLAAKDLFQRLGELAETMKDENSKARTALSSYDKPAWSEFQADANGYERALTEILLLLKFTKD